MKVDERKPGRRGLIFHVELDMALAILAIVLGVATVIYLWIAATA